MFFVDLEPKQNNKEIYNLQYLNNMKITVEPPNKKCAFIQCTICQLYGHSKSYCTRPYKCVKCGGNHMTTDCQKSKETPVKCALSSGDIYCQLQGLYGLQGFAKRTQQTNRNQHTPGKQTIPQNTTHITNSRLDTKLRLHTRRY